MNIKPPTQPKPAHEKPGYNRDYISKNLSVNFETEKENDDFYNLKDNLMYKMGHKRNDKFIMQLMEEKAEELKK